MERKDQALPEMRSVPPGFARQNFNPQNTKCIPAVEIFAFLELDQN
ncbi:MAG: hypothetical protein JRF57_08175 [Deltaproteobacteria bacterium]|nr:hypothetical protein [Deltaproteobacteria bacterium]